MFILETCAPKFDPAVAAAGARENYRKGKEALKHETPEQQAKTREYMAEAKHNAERWEARANSMRGNCPEQQACGGSEHAEHHEHPQCGSGGPPQQQPGCGSSGQPQQKPGCGSSGQPQQGGCSRPQGGNGNEGGNGDFKEMMAKLLTTLTELLEKFLNQNQNGNSQQGGGCCGKPQGGNGNGNGNGNFKEMIAKLLTTLTELLGKFLNQNQNGNGNQPTYANNGNSSEKPSNNNSSSNSPNPSRGGGCCC